MVCPLSFVPYSTVNRSEFFEVYVIGSVTTVGSSESSSSVSSGSTGVTGSVSGPLEL